MQKNISSNSRPSAEPSDNLVPIVSICIPTFNGADTIERTLDSVLNQALSNIEIIICDDNSSDSTLDIVRRFRDPRIRIQDGPNLGSPAANWNRCVLLARGRFVKVIGQDDILYPFALQHEVMLLSSCEHTNAVLSFCRRDIITSDDRRLPRVLTSRSKFRSENSLNELLPRIVRSGRNPLGEPVCVTFNREIFLKTTGFEGSYLIDLTTWIKLLDFGTALHINERLCAFRVSKASWSFQLRKNQARQTTQFFQNLAQLYPDDISQFDILVGRVFATIAQWFRSFVIAAIPN